MSWQTLVHGYVSVGLGDQDRASRFISSYSYNPAIQFCNIFGSPSASHQGSFFSFAANYRMDFDGAKKWLESFEDMIVDLNPFSATVNVDCEEGGSRSPAQSFFYIKNVEEWVKFELLVLSSWFFCFLFQL